MFRLHRFGIKLGLETIGTMLNALGNPHRHYHSIHIAGTNGKGSVAAMLSEILRSAGYKVGRYTSPHLERFNERICIDNEPIGDAEVVESCQRAMAITDVPRQPTFFEFTTAMALDVFKRRGVQWAVIETGMGGRLDATNLIQPVVSIITNISLEHQLYLGKTLPVIAGEKAGIIKPKVPVITGARQKSVRGVIEQEAARIQAPLYSYGRDFRSRRGRAAQFSYLGLDHHWPQLRLGLMGDHQVENAALVLAACEILMRNGQVALDASAIRNALLNTRWPGRLEVAGTAPYLILDGAHNQMAAKLLGRHLARFFRDRNITLVVGILDDKPYRAILKDLSATCRRVIVTQPKIDRAIPAERLEAVAREFVSQVEVHPDVAEALRYALATSAKEDVVCVAGSLYVVGEAKTALRQSAVLNEWHS
ncbi:MAG: bifunctional folylpolyglutamate synthase/dihydrofolate synthase [Desulfobacteraceae bacterium]|nr:MAG: bifunctional folylpolyglutamate synthase/dihydrofolate synthase [Desulfobacteraceae bacterium]